MTQFRKGLFGEKSEHGGYVPLTETEQELLDRMISSKDFRVETPYGVDPEPRIDPVGEKRLRVTFSLPLPDGIVIPVTFIHVRLTTQDGELLFAKDLATMYGTAPLALHSGVELDLHLSLDSISPEFIKSRMQAYGLTTRQGNMDLDDAKRQALHDLEEGKKIVEAADLQSLQRALTFKG